MSAEYAYVTIQFLKAGNQADSEMAKQVFNYCRENYDFFNSEDDDWEEYGDCFGLKNEFISPSFMGDGLNLGYIDEDWFQEIYDHFNPFDMRVEFIEDCSETSYDDNTVSYYKVVEADGKRELSCVRSFNMTRGSKYAGGDSCNDIYDSYNFENDGENIYVLDENDLWQRVEKSIVATNKKTNRTIELFDEVALEEVSDDDHEFLIYQTLYNDDGDHLTFTDIYNYSEDTVICVDDFEGRIEDLGIELQEGETDDPSEWDISIEDNEKNSFFA